MLTYVDDLESDFSVLHGLDFWTMSTARVMRLAPKLPAYEGSLRLAMARDADRAPTTEAGLSTSYPQPVDNGDTPAHVVEQKRQAAMLAQFQAMGVEVTGVETISDDEMERLVNSGR